MSVHVVFFRNLNLGHDGSPSGAQLVEAFGGADVATSFQTNGTVVARSDDPDRTLATARARLTGLGFDHDAFVRPLADVSDVLAQVPVLDPAENVYRAVVSFHDAQAPADLELPLRSTDDLVEVRRLEAAWSTSVCWKPRQTAGDVTGFLERLLGVPVTTRTVNTLERLVARFG